MRILHYLLGLPPVRGGGLVKYALDLAQEEAGLNHEVALLVPGRIIRGHASEISIYHKRWKNISCYYIQNPLPVTAGRGVRDTECLCQRGDIDVYLRFLQEIRPDVVHIHSFMGLHVAFLEAARQLGIPIVYTTHDYYGLCPKATLLQGCQLCGEDDFNRCVQCQDIVVTYHKMVQEQSDAYRLLKTNRVYQWMEYSKALIPVKIFVRDLLKRLKPNKSRKTVEQREMPEGCNVADYSRLQQYYKDMFGYIDRFHFNSSQTKEVFTAHLGPVVGEVLPISNSSISDHRVLREYSGTLHIGFIGQSSPMKGFPVLKEALDALYHEGLTDFECHVYFNPKEAQLPYLKSHAPYNPAGMDKVFANMDVLVLPSAWRETFGMVVLEALSYGVPVILSECVGAKDILLEHTGMGLIVKPDKGALQDVISKMYRHREILQKMNQEICDWQTDFSVEKHVGAMIGLYERAIGRTS